MASLDWILVAFGAVVAITGGWIQLQPERIYPRLDEAWPMDPKAVSQIRRLGASFLIMGAFFALQMTADLTQFPWWNGSLAGVTAAIAAVSLVQMRVRSKRRHARKAILQTALPKKILELR
jgi:predicted small secreted protein